MIRHVKSRDPQDVDLTLEEHVAIALRAMRDHAGEQVGDDFARYTVRTMLDQQPLVLLGIV